jgi:anti-anti-sigma factor
MEMDAMELNKAVNPIYTTAKGTAMFLAQGGDKDAMALYPYLGTEEVRTGKKPPQEIIRILVVSQEARFNIYNNAVLQRNEPVIVDLPSGYSPRGFKAADAGKRYYGLDLPAVIDIMKTAADKTMTDEQKALVRFDTVDATNYDSLKRALKDNKGEICIVTEGLLGYFNEPELVSMCQAVHRLLSEYGGCWITADTGILEIYTITHEVLIDGDSSEFSKYFKNRASSMADVDFYQNSLFLKGHDGAIEFLKKQGFLVQAEPVSRYLKGLRTVDAETEEMLKEKYEVMEIWTLTVDKDSKPVKASTDQNLPFEVKTDVNDGVFYAAIQGRMDTITAPELLKRFKEAGDGINEINIDVSKMAYVSSAGLRVFLMMYKSLEDKERFSITGINDNVREILETTGFYQILTAPRSSEEADEDK